MITDPRKKYKRIGGEDQAMDRKRLFFDTVSFSVLRILSIISCSWWLSACVLEVVLKNTRCDFLLSLVLSMAVSTMIALACHRLDRKSVRDRAKWYALFFAFAAVFALTVYIRSTESLIWIIAFSLICMLVYRVIMMPVDGDVASSAVRIGFLFAVLVFFGFQLKKYDRLEFLYFSEVRDAICFSLGVYTLTFAGWVVLFTILLMGLFQILLNGTLECSSKTPLKRRPGFRFFCFFAVLLCWMPYYIAFYPGLISADSLAEIKAEMGLVPRSDMSPVIHQWMIGLCLKIGQRFGSLRTGVAIYSFLQMVLLAMACSMTVSYLYRHHIRPVLVFTVLASYALFGVNAFYSITMWKNIPFGASSLILMVLLLEEIDGSKSRGRFVALVITAFFFSTLQKNGFVTFLIGFPLFILLRRKEWKRYAIIFGMAVILVFGYRYTLFHVLGVQRGASGEALSVPVQQIARVANKVGMEEDAAEYEILREAFPEIEQMGDLYQSYISDAVKGEGFFHSAVFDADSSRYAKCWLKIGMRHPLLYLEAFLLQCYGYWYPDVQYWIVIDTIDRNDLDIYFGFRESLVQLRNSLYETFILFSKDLPTTILFSLGFSVWVVFLSAVLLHLKGQKEYAAPLVIPLILWITTLGSAVYCEYRYLYGLTICVPLFLPLAVALPDKKVRISKRV